MAEKSGHHFRVTVEKIDEPQDADNPASTLTFEVQHHDDILAIAERVRSGIALSPSDSNALAVGLKLFTGVMLTHRKDPLFSEIQPAMRTFIGNLKSRVSSSTSGK